MMPTPTPWCSVEDVIDIFSQEGVLLSTDDFRQGTSDRTQVENCIERARLDIMQWLQKIYTSDQLAGSSWARWACARLAIVELYRRRGGQMSEGLGTWLNGFWEYLKAVVSGQADIPDVPRQVATGAMSVVSFTHDLRGRNNRVRVHPPSTSKPLNTQLPMPGPIWPEMRGWVY